MAFLHCHNCGWEQDDFWSDSYNPFRCTLTWENDLLTDNWEEDFSSDPEFVTEHGRISKKELYARECERAAKKIRGMKWRTEEEYRASESQACPQCGSALDCD